jgi:hypothetical protein
LENIIVRFILANGLSDLIQKVSQLLFVEETLGPAVVNHESLAYLVFQGLERVLQGWFWGSGGARFSHFWEKVRFLGIILLKISCRPYYSGPMKGEILSGTVNYFLMSKVLALGYWSA